MKEEQNQAVQVSGDETDQRIRCRAYELYSVRGQEPGHELEDWLEAEREVLELGKRAPAHVMGIA